MKIKVLEVGYFKANCYILIIDDSALVIDPGDDYYDILSNLDGLNLKAILITHHHFDHVGALKNFKDVLVYDFNNLKEKHITIEPFSFDIISTKGHTSDSVSFYFKDYKAIFVGDFIFKNSIGRTDLETGNMLEMMESLEKIKKYPIDTIIYPGHGDYTTIGLELENNYYMR